MVTTNKKETPKELRIRCLIEVLENININDYDINKIKKILITKWLIKNFKILNYKIDISTVHMKKCNSPEEYLKQKIKEKGVFYNSVYYEYIEFKYKKYKIKISTCFEDSNEKIFLKNEENNLEICFTELSDFINSNDNSITKNDINKILNLSQNRIDYFITQIEKEKKRIKKIKEEEEKLKNIINEFMNESL